MTSSLALPQGTITAPKGFLTGATYAGIKNPSTDALDLGILFSEMPCISVGVFTTNQIKAAPVLLCQRHLENNKAQAIVVNSGCANACTGEQGLANAEEVAVIAANKLDLSPHDILVSSTGVIGPALPMELIRKGIDNISLSKDSGNDLAKAIMTTDRFPKEALARTMLGNEDYEITIGGIAKGAGMIHPNMATMLCFITTDAAVEPDFLKKALHRATDISFNMITVDGDTSPNDSVIILANGLAANEPIDIGKPGAMEFEKALEDVCLSLAKMIAGDGEGATKLIKVEVRSARTRDDARSAASAVANSLLLKCALHGESSNWGRLLASLGYSGADIAEDKITVSLSGVEIIKNGLLLDIPEDVINGKLQEDQIVFLVDLGLGDGHDFFYTCDISPEYVEINMK